MLSDKKMTRSKHRMGTSPPDALEPEYHEYKDLESVAPLVASENKPKTQYTIAKILQVNRDDESWVKPLNVVKIWFREIRVNNEIKKRNERRPLEEVKDVVWRSEISKDKQRLQEAAEVRRKKLEEEKTEDEKIERQIKITLNKVSPANIEKLREQLIEIAIVKEIYIAFLVRTIFNKACQEAKYTCLYADLCEWLIKSHAKIQNEESRSKNLFRRALLAHCQELFEGSAEPSPKSKINGNVKLIGELFLRDIIPSKLLLICTVELISMKLMDFDENVELNSEDLSEDKLEGALIFVKTAGPRIGTAKLRNSLQLSVVRLDYILDTLREIVNKKLVSMRLRFLIMDVLDLADTQWEEKKYPEPPMMKKQKSVR